MAEHSGKKEVWRVGWPVAVGSLTLLPIERIVMRAEMGKTRVWCWASKEPVALVVRSADGVRVIGTESAEVPLAALREKLPGFDALLASL